MSRAGKDQEEWVEEGPGQIQGGLRALPALCPRQLLTAYYQYIHYGKMPRP